MGKTKGGGNLHWYIMIWEWGHKWCVWEWGVDVLGKRNGAGGG